MRRDERTTKQKLLDVARDHFLEVGAAKFSLREVARRTGLSAPAIYRHYEGKDALLAAVCEEGFRVFAGYLLAALSEKKPLERMRASGREYLRFALERPRDYRIIFMSDLADAMPDDAEPTDMSRRSFEFLVDRVRECMDAKVFAKGDPREVATMIWAHVHGLVSLRLAGHLSPASDREFRDLYVRSTDHLLAGLAAG